MNVFSAELLSFLGSGRARLYQITLLNTAAFRQKQDI